ncbi:MAG: hypothetical protein R2865_14325 [Deinococcales bacterium]
MNLSLGSDTPMNIMKSVIDFATQNGVLIAAVAGNDGTKMSSVSRRLCR